MIHTKKSAQPKGFGLRGDSLQAVELKKLFFRIAGRFYIDPHLSMVGLLCQRENLYTTPIQIGVPFPLSCKYMTLESQYFPIGCPSESVTA